MDLLATIVLIRFIESFIESLLQLFQKIVQTADEVFYVVSLETYSE